MHFRIIAGLAGSALSLVATAALAAGDLAYLHHFGDPRVRASSPLPVVAAADGTIYSLTASGGANDNGILGGLLFRLSADGGRYTVLRDFGAHGAKAIGALLPGGDGFLYGLSTDGIFRVATDGSNYSVINPSPGGRVFALINGSNGRIFGAIENEGVVAFDAGGSNYELLHADGFFQGGSLFEGADHKLYVVTAADDSADGDGAFYRLNLDGSGFESLRTGIPFRGAAPSPAFSVQPFLALQAADLSILGIESHLDFLPPDDSGTFVFRTDATGATWTEAGLTGGASPTGLDGIPTAFFQGSDGAFYGAISSGGPTSHGYVFKFTSFADPLASWQNLFDWPAGYTLGISSKSLMEGPGQKLLGSSVVGGRLRGGTVFQLNMNGAGFSQLFNFSEDGDGTNAAPPVIVAADGRIYGTTSGGGRGGRGTVYRVNPANGDYRVVTQFNLDADGIDPRGGVVDGGDGFLYGATRAGGSQGLGTLFKVRPDGTDFAVMYNFRNDRPGASNPIDPANPTAPLIDGGDGFLYGVGTTGGSAAGRGGVFRAAKDGSLFTNLHGLALGEGRLPTGGLLLGSDNRLYGTTEGSGGSEIGSVFSLNRDGTGFQNLHSFTGGDFGATPMGRLVRDPDGTLYGTTFNGGSELLGTVFRLQPGGSGFAILHHFGATGDGRRPSGGLVEATDGSLLGTTRFGGGAPVGQQFGTVFRLDKNGGNYQVLRSFTGTGGDGESPFSSLARGVGDTFYGTTSLGGESDLGCVFQLTLDSGPAQLAISPPVVSRRSGQTRTFVAAGGTPPYTFSFLQNASGGTIDTGSGLYTAGATDTVLDQVRVTDTLNATATANIAVVPLNLTVTAAMTPQFLAAITGIEGNLVLDNADTVTFLLLPNLTTVGGDLIIANNDQLQTLDLSALATVGGSVDISDNGAVTTIALDALADVGGPFDISNNGAATTIAFGALNDVGGPVDISDNGAATTIALDGLTNVGGSFDISNNGAATTIALDALTDVGGNVTIFSNAPDATTDLSSLTSVGNGTDPASMQLEQGTFIFTSGFTVPANVTLSGFGTLEGNIINSGTIAPGSSPGRFDIAGNLVLNPGSSLLFEIAGPGVGAADQLVVSGSVTLAGAVSVTLIGDAATILNNGAGLTLITAGSPVTGAFANAASGAAITSTEGFGRFAVQYAGQPTVQLAGLVLIDTDGDGLPDGEELAAGTNPASALSVFRLLSVQSEPGGKRITWTTVGGRNYVVQTNGSLTAPFADFSLLIPAPGVGESTTNVLDDTGGSSIRYYRVRLVP